MKTGFPKDVVTKKIGRGHYLISRDDGYEIEVRKGDGSWYQVGNMSQRTSLNIFKLDMSCGYMPYDQTGE